MSESESTVIYSLGHSTRSWQDFVELLRQHHIVNLVDIRRYPGSRKFPHFNKDVMEKRLEEDGIRYRHLPELGGRRSTRASKLSAANGGWRSPAFHAYADYMSTSEFRHGIQELLDLAKTGTTAIMCSEAVPWRCHRQLVSDAIMTLYHVDVMDVTSLAKSGTRLHSPTKFMKVQGEQLTYPA
jgi:uncharacterized protein (DUF488 family)